MDKYCQHQKIYDGSELGCYFFTWSVPNVSTINNLNVSTEYYTMKSSFLYFGNLVVSKDKIIFRIASNSVKLKCFVSTYIGSKTFLLSNSLNKPSSVKNSPSNYNYYDVITLASGDETFQKLKQHPKNTLVFICKIIRCTNSVSNGSLKTPVKTSANYLYSLKLLASAFKNYSETLPKENVSLRVGEETEIVSKAVLCAASPVFAKMFQSDMIELKSNMVTITDIKMPVIKVLVSFLYSGTVPNCELDFLFDLYYAADKYDITELRQLCSDLLLPRISIKNVIQFWKFAISHDDALLKSSAIAFLATNIDIWVSSNEWKNLVNDEPKFVAEVINFLDI